MRLWHVQTGKLYVNYPYRMHVRHPLTWDTNIRLHTWEFNTSIKRVEFSPDGRQLLGVTEKRSGKS